MPEQMERCEWVRDRVEPYLDVELPDGERAVFESHCRLCAACARELSLAIRIRDGLRSLPVFAAPPRVIEQSASEIESGSSNVIPLRARSLRRRFALPAIAAAVAAVVLALWLGAAHRQPVDYSDEEIREARAGMALAFGYVDRYSRGVVGEAVLEKRVVPRIERAMRRDRSDVTSPSTKRS
jgi:anti-sigma factor RsiW